MPATGCSMIYLYQRVKKYKEGLFSMIPGGELQNNLIKPFGLFLFFLQHLQEARFFRRFVKQNPACSGVIKLFWRRKRDSNPRIRGYRSTVFKTAAFNRSAISPFLLFNAAKIIFFCFLRIFSINFRK